MTADEIRQATANALLQARVARQSMSAFGWSVVEVDQDIKTLKELEQHADKIVLVCSCARES